MLASLVIVFREVIEAGLIVGIVLAATRGVPRRGLWVAGGVVGGTLGACLVAAFAGELGRAVQWLGGGAVQRRDPADRRRHADLAQHLDGEPWAGTGARGRAPWGLPSRRAIGH